ncbi:polygalacturonase-like [Hibiscus syriacus]|uniref:polygalacturonase-like n=1 Tax=Hibiscus syriacus TaxID=106335 RepID=UPI001922DB5E|nr:polygalacturonase-like [Hibiscus syriacus]
MRMLLKPHCLPFFMVALISLSGPCFCGYREDRFRVDFCRANVYGRPTRTTTYRDPYLDVSDERNELNLMSEILFGFEYDDGSRLRLEDAPAPVGPSVVDVDDFGAKANGSDDSQFSYFEVTVHQLDYTTRRWLYFDNGQNLRVEGGCVINGNGRTRWLNSCKINTALPCSEASTAVTFSQCSNLRVARLRIENSQQMHLSFSKCVDVKVSNLYVIAPGNSPNTDGIHVTETQNIHIKNCHQNW